MTTILHMGRNSGITEVFIFIYANQSYRQKLKQLMYAKTSDRAIVLNTTGRGADCVPHIKMRYTTKKKFFCIVFEVLLCTVCIGPFFVLKFGKRTTALCPHKTMRQVFSHFLKDASWVDGTYSFFS